MTAALSVRHVTRRFTRAGREVVALSDVSFDVAPGELVCIVGPSGCGKSTLLDLLAGHQSPDEGEILEYAERVSGPSPQRMVVFQEHALFPWLTARQNIEFGLRVAGMPARERAAVVDEWLARVHLEGFGDARVHELSGGMRQRVAIARALALRPGVLLMDEPFAALDAQTRDHLHGELQRLWAETGTTIVFITHNVREAVLLGDRVLVMASRPGRIREAIDVPLPRQRTMEDVAVIAFARHVASVMRGDGAAPHWEARIARAG